MSPFLIETSSNFSFLAIARFLKLLKLWVSLKQLSQKLGACWHGPKMMFVSSWNVAERSSSIGCWRCERFKVLKQHRQNEFSAVTLSFSIGSDLTVTKLSNSGPGMEKLLLIVISLNFLSDDSVSNLTEGTWKKLLYMVSQLELKDNKSDLVLQSTRFSSCFLYFSNWFR